MRSLFFLFIGIFFSLEVSAQNFNYTFSSDSVAWNELSSQTILNTSNSAWNFAYKIPIGFSFNYLGRNFDSLRIETNGYIVFDENHSYSFTAFNTLEDRIDTIGNHSVIGYELSGENEDQVVKIQFKNVGSSLYDEKSASYQIWIWKNGNIEVHVGPTDFLPHLISIDTVWADSQMISRDSIYSSVDSTIYWRIGLINQNMDTDVTGYFIKSDLEKPSAEHSDATQEPVFMNAPPKPGTRYRFSPIVN